jgi:hypothetical protein
VGGGTDLLTRFLIIFYQLFPNMLPVSLFLLLFWLIYIIPMVILHGSPILLILQDHHYPNLIAPINSMSCPNALLNAILNPKSDLLLHGRVFSIFRHFSVRLVSFVFVNQSLNLYRLYEEKNGFFSKWN